MSAVLSIVAERQGSANVSIKGGASVRADRSGDAMPGGASALPGALRVVADRLGERYAGPLDRRSAIVRVNLRRGLIETQAAAGGVTIVGGSSDENGLAASIVNGHRAVVRLADGRIAHYDPTNPEHHGTVIGLSLNAAIPGSNVQVRQLGRLDFPGWSWTRGLPLFAGAAGTLSHAPGAVVLQVAEAASATAVLVRVQPPIVLS